VKRSHRLAVILALALGVVGADGALQSDRGVVHTTAVSAPALAASTQSAERVRLYSSKPVSVWRREQGQPLSSLAAASDRLMATITRGDFAGMHAVCRDVTGINQRIRASLPTPNRALTAALRQLTVHLDDLTTHCSTLSLTSPFSEFGRLNDDFKGAARSFAAAKFLLKGTEPR
jgi:hypothetical protein